MFSKPLQPHQTRRVAVADIAIMFMVASSTAAAWITELTERS